MGYRLFMGSYTNQSLFPSMGPPFPLVHVAIFHRPRVGAYIPWNYPPTQDAIVTTRIIPFLLGNPNLNFHLWLASWGVDLTYDIYHGMDGMGNCFTKSARPRPVIEFPSVRHVPVMEWLGFSRQRWLGIWGYTRDEILYPQDGPLPVINGAISPL